MTKSDKSDNQGKTIIKAFQKAHDRKQRGKKRETEGGGGILLPSGEEQPEAPITAPSRLAKGVMQPAWVSSLRLWL